MEMKAFETIAAGGGLFRLRVDGREIPGTYTVSEIGPKYAELCRETRRFRLERLVDGVWYEWGTFDDPVRLAEAAHELGGYGYKKIRVLVV